MALLSAAFPFAHSFFSRAPCAHSGGATSQGLCLLARRSPQPLPESDFLPPLAVCKEETRHLAQIVSVVSQPFDIIKPYVQTDILVYGKSCPHV